MANLLAERLGTGVEERDAETLASTPPGVTELLVWMPTADVDRHVSDIERLLSALRQLGTAVDPWSWRSEPADPQSWLDAYKRFFTVNRLARRLVVKPSWELYAAQPGDLLIELDPGQAFGTGLHPSTRLAASAIERLARQGLAPPSVVDVGCGTGILAIAAARLWPHCHILAIDSDETAVAACRENVERNGLSERIVIEHKGAAQLQGRFALVIANLQLDLLTMLQPRLRALADEFGRLVLSGLLAEQAQEISRLYCRDLAFEPEYSEEEAGWRALLLRIKS
ncbi:MAG: 50S ribosomal protein L11 methyltransferase [Deltaproteobacteria bacterium]|nr:50S ribosomal protein L11 methyltransferase [Deltaproteobacteria bacterium]